MILECFAKKSLQDYLTHCPGQGTLGATGCRGVDEVHQGALGDTGMYWGEHAIGCIKVHGGALGFTEVDEFTGVHQGASQRNSRKFVT